MLYGCAGTLQTTIWLVYHTPNVQDNVQDNKHPASTIENHVSCVPSSIMHGLHAKEEPIIERSDLVATNIQPQ